MIKNILTTIVAITILFGSLGLDIYKHTCTTHNFNGASFIEIPECEKNHSETEVLDDCCKMEVEEPVEQNCCESQPIDKSNSVSLSSSDVKCCVTSFERFDINENLFPPVEKKNISIDYVSIILTINETLNSKSENKFYTNNNDLPPPIFGKKFLQSIHQLKIATPFC